MNIRETIIAFGSVPAAYPTTAQHSPDIGHKHISIENYLDKDIKVKIGNDEITVVSSTQLTFDDLQLSSSVFIKYVSAPSSGNVYTRTW